ncbi:MAG: hypothetical protein H6642_04415 [Caldilineaceae bacterium]|nr:hypothetical protein [Caldilineaceae bacterium]
MFFDGNIFWLLMGILAVVVGGGFNEFAKSRGWTLTWWKWALAVVWYIIFMVGFYAWGTLIGENEGSAGFKFFLMTMFISAILAVGLWRLLAIGSPKNVNTQ